MTQFRQNTSAHNIKVGLILGPAITSNASSPFYSDGLLNNSFINSTINEGLEQGKLTQQVWNKKSVFPDFFQASAQTIWGQGLKHLFAQFAFDSIWLDANEPTASCDGECPGSNEEKSDKPAPPVTNFGWFNSFTNQADLSTYSLPFIP